MENDNYLDYIHMLLMFFINNMFLFINMVFYYLIKYIYIKLIIINKIRMLTRKSNSQSSFLSSFNW